MKEYKVLAEKYITCLEDNEDCIKLTKFDDGTISLCINDEISVVVNKNDIADFFTK